jgi:hypothetical protein
MGGRALRGAVLALALLSTPLLGCEVKPIQIQLPGYGSGNIDGIWLWKRVAGTWTRVCRIDFEDHRLTADGEVLLYVQNCVNGRVRRGLVLPSPVDRASEAPTTVTLDLYYFRYEDPGDYRATAFNEAGESSLSSTSLPL